MLCPQCNKSDLIRQYRVNIRYFNSLEQAENHYENLKKLYPFSLNEILTCNDCDYVKEIVLKTEEV